MLSLPQDVLHYILRMVDVADLLRVACVCKRLNAVSSHDALWQPIFAHLEQRFAVARWTRRGGRGGNTSWKDKVRRRAVAVPQWGAPREECKVVLVGDARVGKTCLFE